MSRSTNIHPQLVPFLTAFISELAYIRQILPPPSFKLSPFAAATTHALRVPNPISHSLLHKALFDCLTTLPQTLQPQGTLTLSLSTSRQSSEIYRISWRHTSHQAHLDVHHLRQTVHALLRALNVYAATLQSTVHDISVHFAETPQSDIPTLTKISFGTFHIHTLQIQSHLYLEEDQHDDDDTQSPTIT